jgi:hypothetical protein
MLIHIAGPLALYPLWRDTSADMAPLRFYRSAGLALVAALATVATWLGPLAAHTDPASLYDLVWRQAAGRIAGSVESAHARPIYFYLPLLPIFLLPWALHRSFWRAAPRRPFSAGDEVSRNRMRFLALWCIMEVVVFSLIAGKQPHYLVPMLPPVSILFACTRPDIASATLQRIATTAVLLVAVGLAAAAATIFPHYDLRPLADFLRSKSEQSLAFAGRYQGELTFLARLTAPIEVIDHTEMSAWLDAHPSGLLVERTQAFPRSRAKGNFPRNLGHGLFLVCGQPPALPTNGNTIVAAKKRPDAVVGAASSSRPPI